MGIWAAKAAIANPEARVASGATALIGRRASTIAGRPASTGRDGATNAARMYAADPAITAHAIVAKAKARPTTILAKGLVGRKKYSPAMAVSTTGVRREKDATTNGNPNSK